MKVQYEIHFKTNNYIYGNIISEIGQPVIALKRRIIDAQQLQHDNFTLENLNINEQVTDQSNKLILREKNNQKSSIRYRKESADSILYEQYSEIGQKQQQKHLQYQPEKPPKVQGYVRKCYKIFSCMSSQQFLIITPQSLILSDSQSSDNKTYIPYNNIQLVKSYRKSSDYYLRIITDESIELRFSNKYTCSQWMNYITQGIDYFRYIQARKAYCKPQSLPKFMETFLPNDQKQTRVIVLEDKIRKNKFKQETIAKNGQQSIYRSSSIKIIKLKDFQITNQIGTGAFSVVFKAKIKDQIIALKQLSKIKLIAQNHMKYALGQLNILIKSRKCPFIVPIMYAFQTYQNLYLGLQYTPYGTLKQYLEMGVKFKLQNAMQIICQLIIAIEFLHKKKILYRDLKPENILLTEGGHIMLTDFGLARQLQNEQTIAQTFVGTPLYLPPQRFVQQNKGINETADIYGVGCIFYQMLHSHSPFVGSSVSQVIYNIRNRQLEINQELPKNVKNFIKSTLNRDPHKRIKAMSKHQLFKQIDWNQLLKKKKQNKLSLQKRQQMPINYTIDQDYNEWNYSQRRISGWEFN